MDKEKLLLIAPVFFDYYKQILLTAENLGYEADYICDAPSNSNISKAIGRINKNLIKHSAEKYFENKVLPIVKKKKYDRVLVIAGMTFAFTPKMVETIRKFQENAVFVLYQWDGEKNLPFATKIHQYFDKVYTFDRIDACEKQIYSMMPLFYTKAYEEIAGRQDEMIYDCSYVGTAHPKKFKEINAIADALKKAMPRQFIYHYMPSKLKYLYHKMTAPEYKGTRYDMFKTEKLTASQVADVLAGSRCVLDAPQAGQNGLTIRAIECIGAKKKIVTANPDIKNYDFYREANVLVMDETGEIDADSPFFTRDYEELPEELYKKYSLESWLQSVLL